MSLARLKSTRFDLNLACKDTGTLSSLFFSPYTAPGACHPSNKHLQKCHRKTGHEWYGVIFCHESEWSKPHSLQIMSCVTLPWRYRLNRTLNFYFPIPQTCTGHQTLLVWWSVGFFTWWHFHLLGVFYFSEKWSLILISRLDTATSKKIRSKLNWMIPLHSISVFEFVFYRKEQSTVVLRNFFSMWKCCST